MSVLSPTSMDWLSVAAGKPTPTAPGLAPSAPKVMGAAVAPTQVTPPANPNGPAKTGPAPADKSNDIALQNAGLGSVDSQTGAGLSAVDRALGGLRGQYDTEANANEGNYHTQSDTNRNNLETNKESALVNAAQGRRGLFGTLASLGALNGSGIDLANHAVQQGANEDLAGAGNNFATNQTGLDTAIGTFRQQDAERRQNAETAAADAKTNIHNQAAKTKQTFYTNLSNDYAAQGDTANAKKFSDLAASLYPEEAGTSVPSSALQYSGAAFTPGTLGSYLTGANSTEVSATPSNGKPGLPGLAAGPIKRQLQAA